MIFGIGQFTLSWKTFYDLQYENVAEKQEKTMTFYKQQKQPSVRKL